MEYKFREVKCPFCRHIFMWGNAPTTNISTYLYRIKESGKFAEKAKCPKCTAEMLVIDGVFEGVSPSDDKVEKTGIRGI